MITTTTVTTVAISTGLISSLALMTILLLLGLLIAKEVSGSLLSERAAQLSRALNVALIPLGVLFVTTLSFRLLAALS